MRYSVNYVATELKKEYGIKRNSIPAAVNQAFKDEGIQKPPHFPLIIYLLTRSFIKFYKKRIWLSFGEKPSLNMFLYSLYFFIPENTREVIFEMIEKAKKIVKNKTNRPRFLVLYDDIGKNKL